MRKEISVFKITKEMNEVSSSSLYKRGGRLNLETKKEMAAVLEAVGGHHCPDRSRKSRLKAGCLKPSIYGLNFDILNWFSSVHLPPSASSLLLS